MLTIEEGFELYMVAKGSRVESEMSLLDGVAGCLFEDYRHTIGGYEIRNLLRAKRPSVYEDMKDINDIEGFTALLAMYRMDLS